MLVFLHIKGNKDNVGVILVIETNIFYVCKEKNTKEFRFQKTGHST